MARDRFMFFDNFKEIANKLPDDIRLKFYDALMDYVFNEKEPEDVVISALLTAIKPSLDKEEKRGGNHNPNGTNQYKEVKKNQKVVKSGQSGQSFLETETGNKKQEINISSQDKSCSDIKKKTKKEISEEVKKLFEKWWSVYPNKKSKPAALEKFNTLLAEKTVTFDELMKGAIGYSDEVDFEKTETKYIKHPTTWLNQGCWADEYKKHSYFTIEGF